MKKETKNILIISGVAVLGYFLWKKSKKDKGNTIKEEVIIVDNKDSSVASDIPKYNGSMKKDKFGRPLMKIQRDEKGRIKRYTLDDYNRLKEKFNRFHINLDVD